MFDCLMVQGDAREIPLGDGVVQCVVTSPPYWGLRDYGVVGQLGLEETPEEYVEHLVAVFREVRRVLRDDGTVWLNLGDSYSAGGGNRKNGSQGDTSCVGSTSSESCSDQRVKSGLDSKQLVGIPWRVAFALQADGWWLRSDVIWHKPNAMPESVRDRPTKCHEYVFLLTKSKRYFYDQDAVREPQTGNTHSRGKGSAKKEAAAGNGCIKNNESFNRAMTKYIEVPGGRNRRSVWKVATHPYPGAHFATFPPKLVEPMVLAGTSAQGGCPRCGAGWVRVVKLGDVICTGGSDKSKLSNANNYGDDLGNRARRSNKSMEQREHITTGWIPSCKCCDGLTGNDSITSAGLAPVPQLVLDPFAGTGTVGLVAVGHRRRFVGVELSGEYVGLARERTAGVQVALF